jgi:anti-sigma regulatory factor (Ser/Thr protein kinase)
MNFEKKEGGEKYEESFSWENDIENADRAREIAEVKLTELGWPEDQRFAFSLAVDEAVANATLHGNLGVDKKDGEEGYMERITAAQQLEENKAKRVEIFFRFTPEEAFAQIKDAGNFVPEGIVDPASEDRLLKGSGRGLPLIAMKVDGMQFSPGEIIFWKKRNDNEDAI